MSADDPGVPADAGARVEAAWREHWGRLLALLVAQYRRLDLAEDGLADAFEAAARTWPVAGVPENPPAWLLTAARRRVTDRLRSDAVLARKMPLLQVEVGLTEAAQQVLARTGTEVQDERLRLLLLCAHPNLAPESAAALTLRLVLGISTADIARLFLVSTPTMAARLTRARRRLAGEQFVVPERTELEDRIDAVARIAYLAFTAGYAPGSGTDVHRPELAGEALRLVRVLREVAPGRADLDALLALMLLQHARRDARVDETGALVLLPDQDRRRWRFEEINEAVDLLTPWVTSPPTPWLLEALIAAEHAVAGSAAQTAWPRIVGYYRELEEVTGSPVVRMNRAVAVAEVDGPEAGLALLEGLEVPGHRLHGVRAVLLHRAGRVAEARDQVELALRLVDNEAERDHLASVLSSW